MTNPGIRVYVMGPLHQIKHPTVGSRPKACSKICDRGLQNHQQPQSDDRRPWMGTSRRANFKLVMVYRITYGLIDIPAPLYLHPSALSTRGHTLRYMIPYCRTDIYRNSFFPSAIRLWNQLPETVVAAPTLDDFKMGLASQD